MITDKLMEKPWILWRLWNAFVSNGLSMGSPITEAAVGDVVYEEITYSALFDKVLNEALIPGKKYLITDYKTDFNLNISGDYYGDAPIKPLLVTAMSDDQLEPTAIELSHPKDIIYYSINGSSYMPGSTKGCITRRIDTEKNISVPFDFREFKVEVGAIDQIVWDELITYERGMLIGDGSNNLYISKKGSNLNNPLGDNEWWRPVSENLYIVKSGAVFTENGVLNTSTASFVASPFVVGNSQNFIIGDNPINIGSSLFYTTGSINYCNIQSMDNCTFYGEDGLLNINAGQLLNIAQRNGDFRNNDIEFCNGLVIVSTLNNNKISFQFSNNFISSAIGNTIGGIAINNIIGDNFRDNTIGLRFQNNTIGTNFGGQADNYGNQIGNDFHDNVIGNYFSGNVIGNWFYANVVGNDCQSNNLPFRFYSNIMGDSFQNWNGQCALNGEDFTGLTLPASGICKYIFNDATVGSVWAYYDVYALTINVF